MEALALSFASGWASGINSYLVVLVLGLRMLRKRKVQTQRVERLWMFPAFYTASVFLLFGVHAPDERVWLYILLAFFGGAGLGWYRGRYMAIQVDPRTQEVRQGGTTAVMAKSS
jgi:steroid 5-alpha reductase family enzyme